MLLSPAGKTAQAAEAHQEDAEDEADEEPHASCMPFMGRDTPKGPTGRGRPLGLQQACELIWAIRWAAQQRLQCVRAAEVFAGVAQPHLGSLLTGSTMRGSAQA